MKNKAGYRTETREKNTRAKIDDCNLTCCNPWAVKLARQNMFKYILECRISRSIRES